MDITPTIDDDQLQAKLTKLKIRFRGYVSELLSLKGLMPLRQMKDER